jgi:hypothetical protein
MGGTALGTAKLCQGEGENQVAAVACQGHLHEGSERFPTADIKIASVHQHEAQNADASKKQEQNGEGLNRQPEAKK